MNDPKYTVGDRAKIKYAFDSNQRTFAIKSIGVNKIVDENCYSGIADNGDKISRVIESWLEPVT